MELAARQAFARSRVVTSAGGAVPSTRVGATAAFGSSAPLGRGAPTASGSVTGGQHQPFAKSAAIGGRVAPRGIGGFGGTLFSAKKGTQKSGTLHLGLPPAVRGGR